MTKDAKNFIDSAMTALNLQYGFGEYCGDSSGQIVYPYFAGEYIEAEPMYENGQEETEFILTGFARGSWDALDDAKDLIRNYFHPRDGATVIKPDGSIIKAFYTYSLPVPQEEAELKSIEIHLKIIEWMVN